MAPVWPLEILNVAEFTEQGGRTRLTLYGGPHGASDAERDAFRAARSSLDQGFNGTFERLEAFLRDA
jgi:hypothetical protein